MENNRIHSFVYGILEIVGMAMEIYRIYSDLNSIDLLDSRSDVVAVHTKSYDNYL
jgi:hypothetical protein